MCHRRLLHKLNFYGVSGKTKTWIQAFLTNRSQCVVVNQETSESLPVSSGVPQGTVLGPMLFLVYINDLPLCSKSSKIRLFADDAIIYKNIRTEEDFINLQNDLKALEKWEIYWKMEFNPSKCNSMTFTRTRNPLIHTYELHQTQLETVSNAKYLGVTISSKLTWSDHIGKVVSKGNRSLGMLKRNLKVAPTTVKSQAYQTLVRPHLEYASTVWDPHTQQNTDRIEALQRRAARFCFRRYDRMASPSEMIARLGWTALAIRRSQARLIFMYKLCHNLLNININSHLTPITRPTRHSHPYSFQRPATTKQFHTLSYFPRTIKEWNGLPASLVCAPSVEAFSSNLRATAQSLSS